jgi:intracellular septation protein A
MTIVTIIQLERSWGRLIGDWGIFLNSLGALNRIHSLFFSENNWVQFFCRDAGLSLKKAILF